jgi:hypothetical protein
MKDIFINHSYSCLYTSWRKFKGTTEILRTAKCTQTHTHTLTFDLPWRCALLLLHTMRTGDRLALKNPGEGNRVSLPPLQQAMLPFSFKHRAVWWHTSLALKMAWAATNSHSSGPVACRLYWTYQSRLWLSRWSHRVVHYGGIREYIILPSSSTEHRGSMLVPTYNISVAVY